MMDLGKVRCRQAECSAPIVTPDARPLTVRELRDWLADVPDETVNGEAAEVWIMTGNSVSSPCVVVEPLNARCHGGWAFDVILIPREVEG